MSEPRLEHLKRKAQGLVTSNHYSTLQEIMQLLEKEANDESVVGKSEFETVRQAVRRDSRIGMLRDLQDRIEQYASEARL